MYKVVIDAGHGGADPGAVSNGLQEKNITLAISLEVAKRLTNNYNNIMTVLTRPSDKTLELGQRTNKANSEKADALVSIHVNAGGGKGGFETFTYDGTSDARTTSLQSSIHGQVLAQLKPFGVIDRGMKKANLHMCRESTMPAVLTECLFIDVASDADLLKRQDVIEALINGHVLGIAKYLGLQPKQSIGVYVDGKYISNAEIKNGVTSAPIRALCEALGASVVYDAKTKQINITKGVK